MTESTATATASIINKISIKAIGANPKEAIKQEKKVVLAALYGRAVDTKHIVKEVDGKPQESDALLGAFEAVNLQTGETFRSGKLFMPQTVQQMIVAEVKRLAAEQVEGGVEFAFEVSASPSEKSATGYEYQVRPLIKPAVADPLEQMRAHVLQNVKMLEAPKEETKSKAAKK